jgi:isopentenyldiphosphate isomerase
MEFIEEIDKEGNILQIIPVLELKKRLFLHKVALVIPKNSKGEYLIAKRAKNKHPFPGM